MFYGRAEGGYSGVVLYQPYRHCSKYVDSLECFTETCFTVARRGDIRGWCYFCSGKRVIQHPWTRGEYGLVEAPQIFVERGIPKEGGRTKADIMRVSRRHMAEICRFYRNTVRLVKIGLIDDILSLLRNTVHFMKIGQFYDKMSLLWNKVLFMKIGQLYDIMSLLWNKVHFMEIGQLYDIMSLLWN
jgi:hypothetical protein